MEFYANNSIDDLRNALLDAPFDEYSSHCLYIRTKESGLQPLHLNDIQRLLDDTIERQKQETGRVRVIVLKGRQEGVSTYVEGRFIRHTTTKHGKRAFILTHEQDATENLFEMAERFYNHLPEMVKPVLGASNAKELSFYELDSGYRIGTAGNKAVGRSQTIQYFHGSEVAFWPNAEAHTKGVLQAVPDADDTEIILESTANGVNNYFHRFWKSAESGEIDFIAIFLPWFWMEEYKKRPPDDFEPSAEEWNLAQQYDLTPSQLYWRRKRIAEFNAAEGVESGLFAFKQEYPMNAAEAFQFSGGSTLITAEMCMRARQNKVEGWGHLYVGIDPSYGGDRFAVVWRQGPKITNYAVYTGAQVATFQQRLAICLHVLETIDPIANRVPDIVCIDYAAGKDLVDHLQDLNFGEKVRAVHFAEAPRNKLHKDKYGNRRNEIYGLLVEWLTNAYEPVQIPDTDEFQADLCATPYIFDIYERKALRKKEAIIKEYGFSPDLADATALTFSYLISETDFRPPKRIPSKWMSGAVVNGMASKFRQLPPIRKKQNIDNFETPAQKEARELQLKIDETKRKLEEIEKLRRDTVRLYHDD